MLVAAALLIAVHLAMVWPAWTQVGLLADDHELIGAAILRHRGEFTLWGAFVPEPDPGAVRALYRPFVDLLFWLEQPWFGTAPFGYHVTNSVMHCATALASAWLLQRWTGSRAAGLAVALLYVGWPGHSEVLHWIAARTTVQSLFCMAIALVLVERAATCVRPVARFTAAVLAAFAALVALGSKETAVFLVPLALLLAALRSGSLRLRALAPALPLVLAIAGGLWWRRLCLGTWGSGTHYGFRLERVDVSTCFEWLALLLAPAHQTFVGAVATFWVGAVHLLLLMLAVRVAVVGGARLAFALGALLLALGYAAGVGLEPIDFATLENARYSYEPALGLCLLLALGIASLPERARGAALAVVVATHALVFDANRQSWLGASHVYQRMRSETYAAAHDERQPLRIVDAPGVRDGAFACLNGYTEFLFWQHAAPPGVALTGRLSSSLDWRATAVELARQAAAAAVVPGGFTVSWATGALRPLALGAGWPWTVASNQSVLHARAARTEPFAGEAVPIDVVCEVSVAVELRVLADVDGVEIATPTAPVQPTSDAAVHRLWLELPAAAAGRTLPLELELTIDGIRHRRALEPVAPQARSR